MTLAIALLVLWMSVTIELAWNGVLPHGALLLPVACGILFWTRSVSGLLLATTALLIDWIARPGFLPLCPMLLPAISAFLICPSSTRDDYSTRRRSVLTLLTPLHLPLLTLAAVILQLIGQRNPVDLPVGNDTSSFLAESLPSMLMISLPLSAGISMLIRLADELGLRRSSRHWI